HELAIVFAERAVLRSITWIGRVGAAGPLPDDSEGVVEKARAGSDFPFHFGRQMFVAPARKGVGLVIADVANRALGIDWFEASERHGVPLAIDLAPITGRLPLLGGRGRKAVHQPERRCRVTAVFDEIEPFGVGYQVAREANRADQRTVGGPLIVEVKAGAGMADGVDALVEIGPFFARASR